MGLLALNLTVDRPFEERTLCLFVRLCRIDKVSKWRNALTTRGFQGNGEEQQRNTQGGCVRVPRRGVGSFALHVPFGASPPLPPAAALSDALL